MSRADIGLAPIRRPGWFLLWSCVLVAAAVLVSGLSARLATGLVALWPANAVFMGLLLITPRRRLFLHVVVLSVVSLLAIMTFGNPLTILANVPARQVAVVFAVLYLRRDADWISGREERAGSWLRFILLGAVAPFAVAAVVNAMLTTWLTGTFGSWPDVPTVAIVYALQNVVACLLFVPAILRLRPTYLRAHVRRVQLPALAGLVVLLAAVATVVMLQPHPIALLAVPVPLLVLAIRYGAVGAVLGSLVLVPLMLILTDAGFGPIAATTPDRAVGSIVAQIVLALLMATVWAALAALDSQERARRAHDQRLRQANEELRRAAETDPLTGLANRRLLGEMQSTVWATAAGTGEPVSLMFVDVDNFKSYNDLYGHTRGDHVLTAVAEAIGAAARRPTDLAARYGGEEFVMLLPRTDAEGARRVGETIQEGIYALNLPHAGSGSGTVTVSIGIATARPLPGESDDGSLLVAADAALYQAKAAGRNRIESHA